MSGCSKFYLEKQPFLAHAHQLIFQKSPQIWCTYYDKVIFSGEMNDFHFFGQVTMVHMVDILFQQSHLHLPYLSALKKKDVYKLHIIIYDQ